MQILDPRDTRRDHLERRIKRVAQKHLLDGVPESDAGVAQDRRVPGLVAY